MSTTLPTPKRFGSITVAGMLVNAAALGFPDWAGAVARGITALLLIALIPMVFIHRKEWQDYILDVRRRGRLAALIATLVLGAGFVGAVTWLNWPEKTPAGPTTEPLPENPSSSDQKPPPPPASTEPNVTTNSAVTANVETKPVVTLSMVVHRAAKPKAADTTALVPSRRDFYKSHLRDFYAEGNDIYESVLSADSDTQMLAADKRAEAWGEKVSQWLRENMGEPARARFREKPSSIPNINWPGHSEQALLSKRVLMTGMPRFLDALKEMMKSDEWDSSKDTK